MVPTSYKCLLILPPNTGVCAINFSTVFFILLGVLLVLFIICLKIPSIKLWKCRNIQLAPYNPKKISLKVEICDRIETSRFHTDIELLCVLYECYDSFASVIENTCLYIFLVLLQRINPVDKLFIFFEVLFISFKVIIIIR